jgi:hypothetical protein
MKKGLVRAVLCACCVLLCTSCVIYDFGNGLGPWGFEDSTELPSGFTNDSTNPWTIDTYGAYSGSNCARSGSPSSWASTSLSLDVEGLTSTADIHFYWKISGSSSDTLVFYINGISVWSNNGTDSSGTWLAADVYDTWAITEGSTNTLTWTYTHSTVDNFYENCAWVDDISITGN